MTPRAYPSPVAFKQALEQPLRWSAGRTRLAKPRTESNGRNAAFRRWRLPVPRRARMCDETLTDSNM